MTEVLVPYDVEAERSMLGAVMLSTAILEDVTSIIEPGDLYDPRHAAIFDSVRRLHDRGLPTDVIAVGDDLAAAGEFKGAALDLAYLHDLTSAVPSASSGPYYAQIIHDHAIRRRLLTAGTEIARLAANTGVGALDAVEQARERLDKVGSTATPTIAPFGSHFLPFVEGLEEKPKFVPTPWWEINNRIGGFRAGALYTVGARPGQGKSILGLQAALRLCQAGPVAFVSLEMSHDDLMARWIAQIAQVDVKALGNHDVPKAAWEKISIARQKIQQTPLFVATSDEVQTITQVRAFARSVARRAPKGQRLAGLVVDYLQLLTSAERVESRQVEVSGFSRSLKLLAQSLGIPVIALSQLNRASASRRSNRPTLADLRESGAIEQDSDCVFLLHRDEKNAPNRLDVDIAKNRQGEQARVSLHWQGQFSRVMSRAWTPTALIEDEGGQG